MTLTPTPLDPTAALAHMSPRALLAHIAAAVTCLARDGIVVTPEVTVGLEALDECVLEHEHRTGKLPPAAAPRSAAPAAAPRSAAPAAAPKSAAPAAAPTAPATKPRPGFLHVVAAADVGGRP
jgi:hypothetical protein